MNVAKVTKLTAIVSVVMFPYTTHYVCGLCGVTAERSLAIQKVAGSNLGVHGGPLPCNSLGQPAHTQLPLSSSSIIWYRPMGGDALRLGR